jgi:hypothetical protein
MSDEETQMHIDIEREALEYMKRRDDADRILVSNLIRERDEARVLVETLTEELENRIKAEIDAEQAPIKEALLSIAEAEARGYERGVREAAIAARQYKIIADQKFESVLSRAQAGVKNLSLAGACAVGMLHMSEGIEAAILALLEKPTETKQP